MKITQVRLGRISTPLRVPFKTALRTVNSVEDVIVELHTDTGAVGYGEAPPTGVITGDTTGAIIGAIQDHIAPAILGRDLDEFEDLTAAVQKALVHNTSANTVADIQLAAIFNRNGVAAGIGKFVAVQIQINVFMSGNHHIFCQIIQQFKRGRGFHLPKPDSIRQRIKMCYFFIRKGAIIYLGYLMMTVRASFTIIILSFRHCRNRQQRQGHCQRQQN